MSRARLLILLLVLLGAALAYAWWATPRQQRVVPRAGQALQPRTVQQTEIIPEIKDLDFSVGEQNEYKKPKTNLFGALYQPPKKKVVKKKPKPKPKVVKTVPKPVPPPVARVPRPVGPPPLRPLKVLGFLNKAGIYTVFLSSHKGEIFLVKQGDDFADGLQVSELTGSQVTIVKNETGQRQTLRIGKSENQRLPNMKVSSGRPKFVPKEQNEGDAKAKGLPQSPFPTPNSTITPANSKDKARSFIGN